MIALAYVLGPIIGMNAWCAAIFVPAMHDPGFSAEGATTGWILAVVIGGAICLAVELVVLTPLLIGFNRYRWPWLNGWTGAALGFLAGAIPWLAMEAPNPSPSPDQLPGSVTTCTNGRCTVEGWTQAGLGPVPKLDHAPSVWALNGHWTSAGWAHVVHDAAMMGMVGLIAAVVFRLIAVQSTRTPAEPVLKASTAGAG